MVADLNVAMVMDLSFTIPRPATALGLLKIFV